MVCWLQGTQRNGFPTKMLPLQGLIQASHHPTSYRPETYLLFLGLSSLRACCLYFHPAPMDPVETGWWNQVSVPMPEPPQKPWTGESIQPLRQILGTCLNSFTQCVGTPIHHTMQDSQPVGIPFQNHPGLSVCRPGTSELARMAMPLGYSTWKSDG